MSHNLQFAILNLHFSILYFSILDSPFSILNSLFLNSPFFSLVLSVSRPSFNNLRHKLLVIVQPNRMMHFPAE